MAAGELSYSRTASSRPDILSAVQAAGGSMGSRPSMTTLSKMVWLPAPGLRWKGTMSRSSPPTWLQLVISPV